MRRHWCYANTHVSILFLPILLSFLRLDAIHPPAFSSHMQTRWTKMSDQYMYSSKLIEALHHMPVNSSVRDTADRVLAVAARGHTGWSCAILVSGRNWRLGKHNKVKVSRLKKPRPKVQHKKRIAPPPVQKNIEILSRLVPGCRKLSLPSLLEETSDYIAALEMQVRAMTMLTELLNRP